MTAVSPGAPLTRGANAAAFLLLGIIGLAFIGAVAEIEPLTRAALCGIQIICLTLVAVAAQSERHPTWTNPSFIVAAAWAALFVIPSVVYSVAPSLLDVEGVTKAVAAITIATVGFTAGYFLLARSRPLGEQAERVRLAPGRVDTRRAVVLYAIGFLSLGVLVARGGGPIEYLTNLDRTAGVNAGLFYVLGAALCMRWVPMAIIAHRWAHGEKPGRAVWAALIVGIVLITLTGSRMFLAVAVIELAIVASLVRAPIPTSRVLIVGLVAGVVVVFGLGAVKRYQSASTNGTLAGQSFVSYMTSTAPREVVPAYVNNYVDSVRLVALSQSLVPKYAPYETFRPLGELVLKPIPGGLRPKLGRDEAIAEILSPPGDTAYAVPILATAWLSGGIAVLLLVSIGLGTLVRVLDRQLLAARELPTWKLMLLVMAVVQLPGAIRSGIPNGVAQTLTDIIGSALIAWLVIRKVTPAADDATATPTPTKAPVTP